ncbi:hypothetical protein Tco_0680306 [Tanacetum coccineum]|uniref:Uncharacterized protein n=1 Tax=Tanacetum coccineum TaxID=301880 RepID=A0ABQ4XLR3_9ASTR
MSMESLTRVSRHRKDAPVIRTASAAAKPCQGDSLEFYLITEVTRPQEGKRPQDDKKRLCLVDDLKEVQDSHTSQAYLNKLKPKVNDHYNISHVEVKKTSLQAQD